MFDELETIHISKHIHIINNLYTQIKNKVKFLFYIYIYIYIYIYYDYGYVVSQ